MNDIVRSNVNECILLNNAHVIVDKFESQKEDYAETFLTMVQGNNYSDVDITDSNISNNAHFIVGLWD